MPALFRISIHFLQPMCHARGDGDAPEWPPSPLRVFQALVGAAAARWNERESLVFAGPALRWFEALRPPKIRCVNGRTATTSYRLYVPDNIADKVAAVWSRSREASIADYRTEKDIRPTYLDGTAVHYIYSIDQSPSDVAQHLNVLRLAVRSMTHLGWGVDMIAADADLVEPADATALSGEQWNVAHSGRHTLRCPRPGSLDQLLVRHHAFLKRVEIGTDGELSFNPVPPLSAFCSFAYRRANDPLPRPFVVFKLLDENDDTYRYPHAKLIHIAGMVRHLAIDAMTRNPPLGVRESAAWVERYVAGHRDKADQAVDLPHAQLSYIPLPSTGHPHTDPGVRRVMIVAPVGDNAILEHLCRHLDGLRLKPERAEDLRGPVFLSLSRSDAVASHYTRESRHWASFTPVILPGHDDHKPEKTRKLIEKALIQSGIDQPCEFEWSAFSNFQKSLSAHKYDRDKRLTGYVRPGHLQNQTALHMQLRFGLREDPNDRNSRWIPAEYPIPGPLAIGAGRHCGLGVFAAVKEGTP